MNIRIQEKISIGRVCINNDPKGSRNLEGRRGLISLGNKTSLFEVKSNIHD